MTMDMRRTKMAVKEVKINWQEEGLDTYYKRMGHPKKVWKDNEGMPFGIALFNADDTYLEEELDIEWFSTEEERNQMFSENEDD